MPIEMPRGLPFSVDTWTPSSKKKRHHFLTHAHKDHSQGISTHFSYPIYSTHLTKTLTLQHYHQLHDSLFVCIEIGQSMVVNDPDGAFSVTAFDANHCPGAVMFLFEGTFGNILHTGDCRLTTECFQSLPEKYIGKKGKEPRCRLDYVFLDCTFGSFSLRMPTKHSATKQVINCIWKHPEAKVVYLTCDLLGQEQILVDVSNTFGSKIFIDKDKNPECFHALSVIIPQVISRDPSSRFQVFEGYPKLYERAKAKLIEAQANSLPEPLIIRPSTQWYVCDEELSDTEKQKRVKSGEAVKDQFGVWHICYSIHSSKEELEWALQFLAPKRVVSTTPNCRATELDYVKKNCVGKLALDDDPIWKLLDINLESSNLNESIEGLCSSSLIEVSSITTAAESRSPVKISTTQKQLLVLSPIRKRAPVTLFGRARLGFHDLNAPPIEKKIVSIEDELPPPSVSEVKRDFSIEDELPPPYVCEVKQDFSFQGENGEETEGQRGEKIVEKEKIIGTRSLFCSAAATGSSTKSFNESFRKLYRSMNVPVPQPLPSLVELMNGSKRDKRRRFE